MPRMAELALEYVESGLRFALDRAAVLAGDAANARTPGFSAQDLAAGAVRSSEGLRFEATLRQVEASGPVAVMEYAMAAQGENATCYHALADQERAMLHEVRMVAEEARR